MRIFLHITIYSPICVCMAVIVCCSYELYVTSTGNHTFIILLRLVRIKHAYRYGYFRYLYTGLQLFVTTFNMRCPNKHAKHTKQ